MASYWDNSFAQEEIQLLSAALERAWIFIEKSNDFGQEAPEFRRSMLATHIMAIAQTGEKDPLRLANNAIRRYRLQRAQQAAATLKTTAGGSTQ